MATFPDKLASYLWNEKGYAAASDYYNKKVNGVLSDQTSMQEVFDNDRVGKTVDLEFVVEGKYNEEEIAMLMLLENSSKISLIAGNSSFLSVIYVEGKKVKGLTSFIFSR